MTYVDGVVIAVPTANKEAFIAHAEKWAAVFKKCGAIEVMENWGVEVPDGKLTSLNLAVQKHDDETVVFSWVVWPSKEIHDEGWKQIMEDETLHTEEPPFDAKRMIFGGFETVLKG